MTPQTPLRPPMCRTQALALVTTPQAAALAPLALRLRAWAVLKSARGQRVVQHRFPGTTLADRLRARRFAPHGPEDAA